MRSKVLLAFDFNHTLIEANSDVRVQDLSPEPIPKRINAIYGRQGWNKYMGAIFAHLHSKGVKPDHILTCMKGIPLVHGMEKFITSLSMEEFEVIVISDANSVFIDCILENSGLNKLVSNVYTNPAWFDSDGCLRIKHYHHQDWCSSSTTSLCKGHILNAHHSEALKNGLEYSTIVYIGDGSNDLCPSLKLRSNDICFARNGYTLLKKIDKLPANEMQARVIRWNDALDIAEGLFDFFDGETSSDATN